MRAKRRGHGVGCWPSSTARGRRCDILFFSRVQHLRHCLFFAVGKGGRRGCDEIKFLGQGGAIVSRSLQRMRRRAAQRRRQQATRSSGVGLGGCRWAAPKIERSVAHARSNVRWIECSMDRMFDGSNVRWSVRSNVRWQVEATAMGFDVAGYTGLDYEHINARYKDCGTDERGSLLFR